MGRPQSIDNVMINQVDICLQVAVMINPTQLHEHEGSAAFRNLTGANVGQRLRRLNSWRTVTVSA